LDDNPKRNAILQAAREIISRKGLENTSISEIAGRAGVTDSIIYHYFKNKEDLLFSILGEGMKEVLKALGDQLPGIIDPVSQLSKMVWFHLNYNDQHPEFVCLILFECYSNKNFYKHPSYESMRKYSGIILSILENGIQKNVFRKDLNTRILRDMILGVLNWETLSCLMGRETENTVQDFESIVSLLLPMITEDSSLPEEAIPKPPRILQAAEKVFAEKGYHRATIKEIAKLAKVAEGTIYEYFEGKEALLFAIPKERFRHHIETLDELFETPSPLRKLKALIRYHFSFYSAYRDFIKVFLLHTQFNRGFPGTQAFQILMQYTERLYRILEEGKKQGIFRPEINNRVFKNLFLGSFSHMALRWLIREGNMKTDTVQEIEEVVSLFSRTVRANLNERRG